MELLESSYLPSNLNLQHKHIKKNTYFGNWATRKQSPHKKRERTVELKFNLRDDTSEGGYKRGRICEREDMSEGGYERGKI